jgi:outer membrane protein OmpA-like peptidoglycan-associated protein
LNQNALSETAYSKLTSATSGILPEDYYNYAMLLKTDGKYDESNKWMDKFNELKPEDLRAKDYAANKNEFANWSKDDGKYKVEHLNINTDAEDFGPSYYKNKIVFVSTGANPDLMKRTYNWNGKPFLNMYVSEVDNNQLKSPEKFNKGLNGKLHDGPASFSKDGNYMAFTRNNYDTKRKDKIINLQICFSSYKDEKWSKPESFVLNNKEYSVGHPCLTADGNTMYFSSDMPGGYGGADIYRITKDEKGTWGKAENLGNKVNTEGDELFPFYDENNKTLYFSSNGRFGLGGLDIFICEIKDSGYGRIYNAGYPLNTQYDDFSVIVNDNKGYFASNRTGGSGDDDIYSVELLNISKKIQGIAKNVDGNPIPKTFITLLDDKNNVLDTLITKDDGTYSFVVDANKNFKLNGKKEKYIEGNNIAGTFGEESIVKADVTLLEKEEIIARAIQVVGNDLGKILALNSIYFDFHKYNIRPDAQIELNKIVTVMNENPNLVVELSSYTDCRASKEYNQILSDKRAKASAEYIKKRITKPERIHGKGFGETKSINGCECEGAVVSICSEDEYQKDRRTEFIISSNDKRTPLDKLISQK